MLVHWSPRLIYIPICFYYFFEQVANILEMALFTFQYVSIISDGIKAKFEAFGHLHSNMFLLFPSLVRHWEMQKWDLHSNMFLLFHFHVCGNFRSAFIYIPICFYYFLFCRLLKSVLCDIYIPICFYYFYVIVKELCVSARIYIPICFYYFESKVRWLKSRKPFTFQYVSIISLHKQNLLFSHQSFTFQYVSIIS